MASLETCNIRNVPWDLPPGLLTLAQRASLSLRQLSLTLRTRSGEDSHSNIPLFEVLQVTCELTNLELFLMDSHNRQSHRPLVNDQLSKLLIKLRRDHPSFLPKLNRLYLRGSCMTTLTMHIVQDILGALSAWQLTSHPLTDVCLMRISYGIEQLVICPDVLERIRILEEESGIKVVIKDGSSR
ncbi:hypothetical protein L218DRAFT_298407 [Marasmius fiardii PR-910]|nr:hypothetical protein L218DRAFT_298407 [Marasmius fiardii PR-910]